jgi:hypothetical protein
MLINNLCELNNRIRLGETEESLTLEFKREIDVAKDRNSEEIALDICQFLNTKGGVILVGAKEELMNGKKVITQYLNIDSERVLRFLNDTVITLINPKNITVRPVVIGVNSFTTILAINISPLINGVSCVCKMQPPYSQKYPYRTHYGKKYFTPIEVEQLMSNQFRYISIKLEQLIDKTREVVIYPSITKEEIANASSWDVRDDNILVKSIGQSEYRLNICGIDINVPFSLTNDVWETEDGKIGVYLKISLVVDKQRKKINFTL